jgi:hypothetical protein
MAGWQGEDKKRTPEEKRNLALRMFIALATIVIALLKFGV